MSERLYMRSDCPGAGTARIMIHVWRAGEGGLAEVRTKTAPPVWRTGFALCGMGQPGALGAAEGVASVCDYGPFDHEAEAPCPACLAVLAAETAIGWAEPADLLVEWLP